MSQTLLLLKEHWQSASTVSQIRGYGLNPIVIYEELLPSRNFCVYCQPRWYQVLTFTLRCIRFVARR